MSGRHIHLAVEAARTHQRRVEHVGRLVAAMTITPVGLEAVHLDQQLVQRLLALVAAPPRPAPRWRPTASRSRR
jgi:hypothetical protein